MIILLVQCFVLLEAFCPSFYVSLLFFSKCQEFVCVCVCVHVFHIKILLKYLMIFDSVHIEI